MKKIINGLCSFLKYVCLIISFGLTLFIILRMYTRLNKSLTEAIFIFLPYFLLLILFIVNSFWKKEGVTKNIFYNITATLVFATNIFVCYRAVFDKNMLFNNIQKMGVNFNYFNDYLSFNRIMLYGLIIANIVFMFLPTHKDKDRVDKVKEKEVKLKSDTTNKEESKVVKKVEVDSELI